MSSSAADAPSEEISYVRGVRVGETDTRRVVGVLLALCLLVLLTLTVVLAVQAAHDRSRSAALRNHGVAVVATVSSCEGVGSGIGDGIQYWVCRGTYTLDGTVYDEVINGSRALLEHGAPVAAIAVPGRPSLLATAASVKGDHSTWTAYQNPIIVAAVFLVLLAAAAAWWRWSGRRSAT
jgi:hypothetical protein